MGQKASVLTAQGEARARCLPQHHALLERSGISPDVAAARGYFSARSKADLQRLGFGLAQQLVPTLVIPVHSVTGDIVTYQHRPDSPRVKDGKTLKYETPWGSRMALDRVGGVTIDAGLVAGLRHDAADE